MDMGLKSVNVCTYQAISGAGKSFDDWPEMIDNVIPFIGGEEEKSELEPLKVWGIVKDGVIVNASSPVISAQCVRVPVTDGHMAAVFAEFDKPVSHDEIIKRWNEYKGLDLPNAPKQFLRYFTEDNFPQTKLHRDLENGMGISLGRLRSGGANGIRFICLSHNTLRGAAGGAVLTAEFLADKGYL
jgi:aspartate-semialdehyde dehydrogenase